MKGRQVDEKAVTKQSMAIVIKDTMKRNGNEE